MDTIVEIKKTFYESFHGHHCRNKEDIFFSSKLDGVTLCADH